MTPDPQRRTALLGLKLGALVRDHADGGPAVLGSFGAGAALARDGQAWVLADERPERILGPALAWARQQGLEAEVNVVVDDPAAAGVVARRARYFAAPPKVWRVDGRALVAADPAPFDPPPPVVDDRLSLLALIEEAGAVPVVEHGVVAGEVAGLEVCRAVIDPDLAVTRLEVGVGAHDREAFSLVHGDVPPLEALADVVAKVAEHRRPGADPHPLNRLNAERLLRWRLIEEPHLVGALVLEPAPPPVPRPNLKDPVPCVAVGVDTDGQPVVVVSSVGIDLDLVPFAADARSALGSTAPVAPRACPSATTIPSPGHSRRSSANPPRSSGSDPLAAAGRLGQRRPARRAGCPLRSWAIEGCCGRGIDHMGGGRLTIWARACRGRQWRRTTIVGQTYSGCLELVDLLDGRLAGFHPAGPQDADQPPIASTAPATTAPSATPFDRDTGDVDVGHDAPIDQPYHAAPATATVAPAPAMITLRLMTASPGAPSTGALDEHGYPPFPGVATDRSCPCPCRPPCRRGQQYRR